MSSNTPALRKLTNDQIFAGIASAAIDRGLFGFLYGRERIRAVEFRATIYTQVIQAAEAAPAGAAQ